MKATKSDIWACPQKCPMPQRAFLPQAEKALMRQGHLGSGFPKSLCAVLHAQNASSSRELSVMATKQQELHNSSIPHAGLGFNNGIWLLFGLLFFISACQSGASHTPEELNAFYEEVEFIFEESGEFELLDQLFHNDALIAKALKDAPGSQEFRDGFESGIRDSFTGQRFFSEYIDQSTTVELIGLRDDKGLFRVVRNYGEVEYLFLYPDLDGEQLGIADLMFLTDGEPLSKSIRRSFNVSLAEADSTFSDPVYDVLPIIQTIVSEQDIDKVADNLDKLADQLPREKMFLLMDLHLCSVEKPERLETILERFDALDPNDPTPYLHLLMSDFQEQKLKLPVIDELDRRLGGDPYLNLYRAMYYRSLGEHDKALSHIREGIAGAPETPELYFTLFDVLILKKDFDGTIKAFNDFLSETNLNPADFLVYDPVEDFLLSDQFATWIDKHPLSSSSGKHWVARKDSLNAR